MFVALTCFHKSLKNKFLQERLLLLGIKSFYLFYSTWIIKHIFSYIFNALTSLLQKNANFFCRFKDERMAFPKSQKIFRNKVPLKAWRSWVSTMYVMTFCCHKEAFQKQITPCHDYLPFFSFQAYSSSMLESTFSTLYIMTSHMSTFLSRTHFPHFQFIFCFLNKTI